MTGQLITGHVFRRISGGKTITGTGNAKGWAVKPGMCAYLGTCNQPADAHIDVEAFRAQRRAAR